MGIAPVFMYARGSMRITDKSRPCTSALPEFIISLMRVEEWEDLDKINILSKTPFTGSSIPFLSFYISVPVLIMAG
jgi:hypothetical protein